MTATTGVGAREEEPKTGRSRAYRRGLLTVLAVVLLAPFAWAGWWWTHPTLLRDTSPIGNFYADAQPLGSATMYATVATAPEDVRHAETVTLQSARAHFVTNTAAARARFVICERRAGAGVLGSAGQTTDMGKFCSHMRPVVSGTTLRWDARRTEYVLLEIAPTRPGTAHVDAVTFSYARSWRHFHQHGDDRSDQQDWVVRATA